MDDQDILVLPIFQENVKLKRELQEMVQYIKELQQGSQANKSLFTSFLTVLYPKTDDKSTQTLSDKPSKAAVKPQKLQLYRNWQHPI